VVSSGGFRFPTQFPGGTPQGEAPKFVDRWSIDPLNGTCISHKPTYKQFQQIIKFPQINYNISMYQYFDKLVFSYNFTQIMK